MALRFRIARFARAEDGAIMVMWALSLAAFFGLIALAFDIGRLGATQSELQSFADNVALAAAGELDGKADAITRARAAAANLISDRQTFGNGAQALAGVGDYTLTFYRAIPADDSASMNPADATNVPALAAFVEVVVQPRVVDMVFASATAALIGSPEDIAPQVGASAVAGYTQEACDITPLMFCLPSPSFKAEGEIGTMLRLRSSGGGAAWGPGDFGFLDPTRADLGATCAGLNGAQLLTCLIGAEQNVTQCYTQRGVTTDPGHSVGTMDAAFNVRFDIFKATMNGKRTDPRYAPAPNVVKGIVPSGGGACINNEAVSPDTVALPRDTCFGTGSCARFGDGNWNYGQYIDANHGNRDGVFQAGEDAHLTAFSVDPKYAGTRYATYLREIQYGNSLASRRILPTGRAESGRAQCAPAASPRPERRVLVAAGIDCTAYPIAGRTTDIPVEEFFEVFLTEPVGNDGTTPTRLDLWVEIIGSAGGHGYSSAGPGGIFRDVVQLYR